jgi:large subunit ribosomal protein L4
MATVTVYNLKGEETGSIDLPDEIFANDKYDHLLHEMVRYQQAARRQGTHSAKGRSAVRGGGAKMYRQKGTGRARHGGTRAPQFRGGGVAHGPVPRDYGFKLNKKVRRNALKSAIARRTNGKSLIVFDSLDLPDKKTRPVAQLFNKLGIDSALVVLPAEHDNFACSARNIPRIKVLGEQGLNVEDILRHKHLVVSQDTVNRIRERFTA